MMKTMNAKDVCRMQKMNLYMYAENEPAIKRNEAVLNDLSGEFYKITGNDKIPDNCRYSLAIQMKNKPVKKVHQSCLS